jgi:CubicO group peptidase (beta-lactamase class C family)
VHDENCYVLNGVSAHAGLFSTADDIAKFAACMLRGGDPIFSPDTVRKFTRRDTMPPYTTRTLGWDTPSQPSSSGRYFSPYSYGHLGFTGTSLWIDPEADLAIVLLTNRVWPDRSSQLIKQFRPAFHDAVREELGLVCDR